MPVSKVTCGCTSVCTHCATPENAAWDRPPQRISISPETDTPEDAEIRALVKKRYAEKLNQILTRNAEEALKKDSGIESIDYIITKPRKKKAERKK